MRTLTLSYWALTACLVTVGVYLAHALPNGVFTATWDPPDDPRAVYEFRWRHFAAPAWEALPAQEARARTFTHACSALPVEPATDRWMCLDARSRIGDLVSPWLSETASGPACAAVEVGIVAIPAPPALPPTPDVFTGLTQLDGRLSVDYQIAACPRGVQQTTSAVVNGRRTITLRCRR